MCSISVTEFLHAHNLIESNAYFPCLWKFLYPHGLFSLSMNQILPWLRRRGNRGAMNDYDYNASHTHKKNMYIKRSFIYKYYTKEIRNKGYSFSKKIKTKKKTQINCCVHELNKHYIYTFILLREACIHHTMYYLPIKTR